MAKSKLLLAFLIFFIFIQVHVFPASAATTETRYFANTSPLRIQTSQTSTGAKVQSSGDGTGFLGIKVYVGATLVSGDTLVAQVNAPTGTSPVLVNGTWDASSAVNGQIKVEVVNTDDSILGTWYSAETNLYLWPSTWTVQYSCYYSSSDSKDNFCYGNSSWNSFISGFKWDTVPANSVPTLTAASNTNFDDTNNVYAQNGNYLVRITYKDANGYADIRYCELFIKSSGNVTRAEFAYFEDTQTMSTVSGGTEWTLASTAVDVTRTDVSVIVNWYYRAHWDATEESGCTFLFFVNDTAGAWANSNGGIASFDVVTRVVDNSGYPSADDTRINVGGGVAVTAQIRYGNNPGSNTPSTVYPPDAEITSLSVHNSVHAGQGSAVQSSGTSIISFAIPALVQSNTYHVYVDYVDADKTDGDTVTVNTVAVVGDRIRLVSFTTSDADGRLNCGTTGAFYATVSLEYDGHILTSGDSVCLSSNNFLWSGTNWQFSWSYSYPAYIGGNWILNGYNFESTYGITAVDTAGISASLTWDRIIINTLTVNASRTNINTGILYQATAALEYDSPAHPLGSGDSLSLGGIAFTWNGTSSKWEYSTSKTTVQALSIASFTSGTESTYTITVGNINSKSATGIWDSVTMYLSPPTSQRINVNQNASGINKWGIYNYDSTAYVGTITLNQTSFSFATAQRQGYNVSGISGGSYPAVTLVVSCNTTYCIWDSVTCYLSPPTYQRINIGANASGVNKWGTYDYDGTAYDGTITLNQTTFSFASPQRQGYNASSISGGTYPSITTLSGCNTTYCIWDSITLYLSPPTNQRININQNASGINKWGIFNYDSASYDGTITLNQTNFSFSTPQRQDYNASSISGGSYPEVTLVVSCNTTYCVWDSITAYVTPPTDQRININENASGMQVWATYDYDNVAYSGTLSLNNTQYSYATVQRQDYNVTVASGGSYPQVTLISSSNTTYCIWDNLIVDTKGATNSTARINVNDYVQIYFKLTSQYDGSYVESGSVTLNGSVSATWVSGNSRWEYNTTKTSAQSLSLYVSASSWSTYDITSLSSQTSNFTSVIWDRITVYAKAADSAVPTNTYVTVWFMARYEYDLADYTSGSLSINGTSSTYNATMNYWSISVVNASVTSLVYQVSAVSDSTFSLTVFIDGVGAVSVQWYSSNTAPTADCVLSSTVYAYQSVNFSVVLNDADGAYSESNGLLNCSVSFNVSSVQLYWFASDNSTSKIDPYGYWSLDASYTVSVNSTAVNVTWTIRMCWNSTKGGYNATCTVWDKGLENGADSISFSFVDDLVVDASTGFDKTRCDPSGSLVVTGQLFYQGTSTPPYDVTEIIVYCGLNGTVKGSNSSLAGDGSFRISFNAEASPIGAFYYTVYSLTDEVSTTNKTASFILDRILVQSGGIGSHREEVGTDALVYYTILYESDLSTVTDGSVMLNTTAMTYNGGLFRWELNVTSATVGNFTYYVASVSGNLYGVTVINDAAGCQYCFFFSYLNVNVRTVDVDGNLLSGCTVYLTNGTVIVPSVPSGTGVAIVGLTWYSQACVDGWANWTGQTNSSVQIYVVWKGLTVNSTFTLATLVDQNVDVYCLAYPYIYASVRFWCASNATILSASYSSSVLSVTFNAAVDSYLFVASCTTEPRYVADAIYDLDTDFASGYLTLTHYGNVTLKVSYETSWGNVYVQKTDRRISTTSWSVERLTLVLAGSLGDIGNLKLICLSRGSPALTDGFVTTTYASGLFTGNYVMDAGGVTVFLDWHGGGSPGGGGAGGALSLSQLLISVTFNVPESFAKGTTVNATMNVTWTGFPLIYVWDIRPNVPYTSWQIVIAGLPLSLRQNASGGFAVVPITFTVPADQQSGSQIVSVSVSFAVPAGTGLKTLISLVPLQVASLAEPVSIPNIMVFVFLAMLGSVPLFAVFRTKRRQV